MNKKFTEFFNRNMMSVEKNTAYGIVNGYETSAVLNTMENNFPFRLHIGFYATDEQKRNIEAALRNAAIKFFRFEISPYGLLICLNDITMSRLINRLPSVFDTVYGIISENGALGEKYCPVCGGELEENASKCNIDGYYLTIDEKCKETINSVIDAENKDFAAAPNNYLKGFLGAVIGGLVGVVIAILLNFAGFIASISSVVAVIVGCFLYRKLGGKPNKMMFVIVGVTTFLMMLVSVPIIYIIMAGIAAQEVGGYTTIEAFMVLMGDAEYAGWFYGDLAMTALFSIVGVGLEIFNQSKLVKRRNKIS